MTDRSEVFALRDGLGPSWQVRFQGRVCSPTWTDKGPASAYLAMLQRGDRQPEYRPDAVKWMQDMARYCANAEANWPRTKYDREIGR